MARYPRHEGYIGLAKQAAQGTGVAPAYFVKWDGESGLTPEMGFNKHRLGGDGLYPSLAYKTQHKPDGQFELLAQPDIAGFLLAMLLGADALTGTGPYTHTITRGARTAQPWVTVERSVAGVLIDRIIDGRIKSVVLSGVPGQPIKLAVTFLGITSAKQGSAASPSYETETPFFFWDGTYTIDTAQTAKVTRFQIEMLNRFAENEFTSDLVRSDLPLLDMDIKASWGMKFEEIDPFAKTYFGSAAGAAPSKTMPDGSLTIAQEYGTGAAQRKLQIAIPLLKSTAAKVELAADDENSQEYACEGEAVKGTGNFVTATVINNKATAYV